MSTKTSVGSRLETKTAFIKELIADIQKGVGAATAGLMLANPFGVEANVPAKNNLAARGSTAILRA